jgi:hypothetical protein
MINSEANIVEIDDTPIPLLGEEGNVAGPKVSDTTVH